MAPALDDEVIEVRIEPEGLDGLLGVPTGAPGIVIFAHGSGSGRLSPRNNHVAAALRRAGLATFLLDLLTVAEEGDRANVFDIPLLASRLRRATEWVKAQPTLAHLVPGYFGASTGAGAALMAAAELGADIGAVVSRGGRPDLALEVLHRVVAPTLLLVGGLDGPVIDMNRAAYERLPSEKQLIVVPGAGHLFEEPGTLDQVVRYATEWFATYLDPVAKEKSP